MSTLGVSKLKYVRFDAEGDVKTEAGNLMNKHQTLSGGILILIISWSTSDGKGQ